MKLLHEKKREINLPMEIVIENFCDLDHVNYVHKRCYKYCNIVRKKENIMFLDVGVYPIPPLPIAQHYTMFHEFIPPNKIIHYSKKKNSNKYVKSQVIFEEKSGVTTFTHKHQLEVPFYLYPFKKMIIKLVDRWSDILWEEDSEIMKIRYAQLKNGFKDGAHCGKWVLKDGKPFFEFYDINKTIKRI